MRIDKRKWETKREWRLSQVKLRLAVLEGSEWHYIRRKNLATNRLYMYKIVLMYKTVENLSRGLHILYTIAIPIGGFYGTIYSPRQRSW